MSIAKKLVPVAVLVVVYFTAFSARAVDDFNWKSNLTGSQLWRLDGNWQQPSFPNSGDDAAAVAVSSDLSLDVGDADVAVVALTLNGTGAGTDIVITSSGAGQLVFQNDDDNTFTDPLAGPDVENFLNHESLVNHGRVYVSSLGAAGSTNTISAPIRLRNNGFLEGVDFFGSRSITLSGPIKIEGAADIDSGQLRSYLPAGTRLLITGDVDLTDAGDLTTGRFLTLNNYHTSDHAEVPRGIIDIAGTISGAGGIIAGVTWAVDGVEENSDDMLNDPAPAPGVPLGTVILRGNNTFTEDALHARGNLVLAHDGALGVDNTFRQAGHAGESKEVGYNVISTSDDRNIPNNVNVAQWTTVKGAVGVPSLEEFGDHSIGFSGQVITTNTRGWINLLPSGKTLTLSGPQYPLEGGDNRDNDRIYTVDGSGKTIITGGMHNRHPENDGQALGSRGHFRVRGSGTVVVDFDSANAPDTASDFIGYTWVEGGNLHFAQVEDLGEGEFLSRAGAVGVDAGVVGNSTFLDKLRNSSNPNVSGLSTFFLTYITGPILTKYAEGGLMLAATEYNQNLNFTTGSLANAANMTLAAHEGGSTYTGTITPSSTIDVNPNTYQLGGGSGTLTLPNAQLTGARNLLVTNGGEVRLEGANTYSGTTRVIRKYRESLLEHAIADNADPDSDRAYQETSLQVAINSTLTVTNLANGGAASSLGSSSNAAGNLLLQGSTLKYAGNTPGNTNRLFTVGTAGATLDASGDGAANRVNFSNTAALAIDNAETRDAVLADVAPLQGGLTVFGLPNEAGIPDFDTDDLVLGMRMNNAQGEFTPPAASSANPIVIMSIPTSHVVQVGQVDVGDIPSGDRWNGHGVDGDLRTIMFGPAPARTLTLTGANSGDNTLAPLVGNAPAAGLAATVAETAAGYGTVGITKSGGGKWILTGNNTYSGQTNVEAGTLLVNGNQTGAGVTTVSSGASFGGTGQVGGGLTMLEGSIYTAAFAGGTIDSLNVIGNLNLSALGNVLNVTGTGVGTSWTLLTYAGTLTGTFESTPGYSVNYGGGTNSLITITKVSGPIGDYNNDGTVNAADYTVWQDNLGAAGSTLGANRDPLNGSGVVTIADYNSWKAHFGQSGAGSGGLAGNAAVPEPASLLLAMLGFAGGAIVLKRGVLMFDSRSRDI